MKMLQQCLIIIPLFAGLIFSSPAHSHLQLNAGSGDSSIDAANNAQPTWQASELQLSVQSELKETIGASITLSPSATFSPSADATDTSPDLSLDHSNSQIPNYETQSLSATAQAKGSSDIASEFSLLFSILFFCVAVAVGKHVFGTKSEK